MPAFKISDNYAPPLVDCVYELAMQVVFDYSCRASPLKICEI